MLFKEIIGQSEIKARLIQSVSGQRISHAQLFFGPEGSGALPLAIAYAQFIACAAKTFNDSCGGCPSCMKFAKLAHPDLHFVFPITSSKENETSSEHMNDFREAFLSNPYLNLFEWLQFMGAENKQGIISVHESASILRKLSLTTYESEFKTVIIWMPEKMNIAAANKLLKILEEPPDKTLFLLVTESEEQLLRTIVSRTQLIKIQKIADSDLKHALTEKNSLSEEEASKISYLANGNYNEALKLLSSENDEEWNNQAQFVNWMRKCVKKDLKEITGWVDEVSKIGRERQKNFLAFGLSIFREALQLNYGDYSLIRVDGEELEWMKKFAPFVNGENCERLIEEFNKAIAHIERNANPKILFLDLSLSCLELLKKPTTIMN